VDVIQKVKDLTNLALDERTPPHEAANAAVGALRLIEEYKLLSTRKRIDVAVEMINMITNPLIADEVASRAEKISDVVDRVAGALKRVTDKFASNGVGEAVGRGGGARRRRYKRD
jgi:hypothetical protein